MTSDPSRDVTLQDVAREAGVAVSTVSRALSNPERVNRRTREHVLAVAQRLDYQPNRLARALPSGRTQILALLVPDVTNPHNFALVHGAEAQARAAGYTLVVADTQGEPELETAQTERLGGLVDGMVFTSSRVSDEALARLRGRRPVVLFNRPAEGIDCVLTDVADGGRQVVEHLAALGHTSIAYLGGPANAWSDGQRWAALASGAERAGIAATRVGPFAATLAGGTAAADVGLATGATALVAFNDLMAIGVLQRLERRGVRVPEAVSVVGHDDIFGADFCNPPLTTVASPSEHAGRVLIDLLLDPPASPPTARRPVLPLQLRIRESTAPPAGPGARASRTSARP